MIDDDRLEAVLVSVGADLDTTSPEGPAPRSSSARRSWLAAAVAVAVVAGGVLAVAPARRTVGGWLGIGRTELRVDSDLALPADHVPGFVAGGEPIRPSRVAALAGIAADALDASPLGPPEGWLAAPEGGAVAVWADHAASLWVLPTGDTQAMLFSKTVGTAERVRELPDLGDGGVLVEGRHLISTPFRTVPADSVVLWTFGDTALRLEATPAADVDLVQLATALHDAFADEATSEIT